MTKRVGIYCRISSDRVGAGLGIDRQEDDCAELARRLGWPVVDVYQDNDLSAYSGKPRPEYRRLLADIKAGRITAVIAWHADRLHRSPAELEDYIAACEAQDVPTHTVQAGELDLTTASGRMTARIIGAVARHESEQKSERLRRQRKQAQANGGWIGGPRPLGYEPDGVTVRVAEGDRIADATRRILAGDSLRSVAAEWNRTGFTTSTGKNWTTANLREVLVRPRNAGLVGKGDRIVGEATWEPIVPRETWEALRALVKDPARLTHKGVSRKLVGSYLYLCECGQKLRSGGNTPTGKARYRCPVDHICRVAEPVDDYVLGVAEAVLHKHGGGLLHAPDDVSPLRERLTALRTRESEIAGLFGDPDSGMTAAQFKAANSRLQADIAAVEAEIGRKTAGTALAGVADTSDPVAAFRALDLDRKRAALDALMTVTLLRVPHGRRPGGSYFDPASVRITPRGA